MIQGIYFYRLRHLHYTMTDNKRFSNYTDIAFLKRNTSNTENICHDEWHFIIANTINIPRQNRFIYNNIRQ